MAVGEEFIIDVKGVIHIHNDVILSLFYPDLFRIDPYKNLSKGCIIIGQILFIFLKDHVYVDKAAAGQLQHVLAEFEPVLRGLCESFRDLFIDHIVLAVSFIIVADYHRLDLAGVLFLLIELQSF